MLLMASSVSAGAAGSPGEDISVDSWVYDAVFELSSHGHFPALLLHTRPWSRGSLIPYLREAQDKWDDLTIGDQILFSRLLDEFHEELATGESDSSDETVRLGIGPTARTDQVRQGVARNRAGFDAIGSFSAANALTARIRVRFDTDGRYDTQFAGEYWKEKFTAWVEQAVVTARVGRFTGAFGREYWRWGRSPVDAMLVSDHSPPFNGLRLQYRSRRWSFALHATMLDSMQIVGSEAAKRYLIGHRLDWRPRANLELAISEVILFGGPGRPWALNYLNPVIPYYWEQLNNNTNDNPLWNIEASWRPWYPLEIYGELMIDDFQIDLHSEPQQIGVLIGGAWTGGPGQRLFINSEYERINTFVYGQGIWWNHYYHRRDVDGNMIGIGSNLGTDADRITIRPRWHQSRYVDLIALLEKVRHGSDRIDSVQAGVVAKGVPFPSGIVESRTTGAVGAHIQYRGNVIIDALVGYERVTNVGNVEGIDREGVLLRVRMTALVWRTFGV